MRLGDPFVSRNPRGVFASHSLGQMLGYAYTICSLVKLQLAQFPVDYLAQSYILSVLICCIHLLCVDEGAIPLVGTDTLELGTHYHFTLTSHTQDTVRRVGCFFAITPSRAHVLTDRAVTLNFAKGAFFEVNRGKNQALYLYLPELLICVKGITEIIFYFAFSFMVKEGFTVTLCDWWFCIYHHITYISLWYGTIYQPLRSGRIWHKVNF